MGKRRDLTDFERGMIVGARSTGASISKTAALVNCSRAAVITVYREWTTRQKTGAERKACGRKRLLDVRAERRVARLVQANRRATVRQITDNLNQGPSLIASQRTVRRTLHRMGYRSRRPVRTPLISAANKVKRLHFAQEHRNWTINDWKRVMWSDESRFQLHHADGRVRVWRKQHESMDPSCMVTTIQAGGGNVMVWSMFSWEGLIRVEQRLTAQTYVNIIADQVHPVMLMLYPNGDGYFQQDNAPCHRAHIVSEWFQEHDEDFSQLHWPPQSPYLNPIEHLWDEVERNIRILDPLPSNLRGLEDAIQHIWANFSQETYRNLVDSMPRRIAAVLRAKGGPTTY